MTKFKIQFLPMGITVEADTENPPKTKNGRKGSLLGHALNNQLEMDHACGGVCACSTCHVVVNKGLKSLSPAEDDEEDMLDLVFGLKHTSRLCCQIIMTPALDGLTLRLPEASRNLLG